MPYPTTYSTPSSRWTAIVTRDPSSTSSFIYAVHSTKIYCRPTCPARLARRANVTFYSNAQEAVVAGYRACLRCKPDDSASQADPAGDIVERVRAYVHDQIVTGRSAGLRIEGVARAVGIGARYLQKVFKGRTGSTMGAYLEAVRKGDLQPDGRPVYSIGASSEVITPDSCMGSEGSELQSANSWPWSLESEGCGDDVVGADIEWIDPIFLEDWIDWDQCDLHAG